MRITACRFEHVRHHTQHSVCGRATVSAARVFSEMNASSGGPPSHAAICAGCRGDTRRSSNAAPARSIGENARSGSSKVARDSSITEHSRRSLRRNDGGSARHGQVQRAAIDRAVEIRQLLGDPTGDRAKVVAAIEPEGRRPRGFRAVDRVAHARQADLVAAIPAGEDVADGKTMFQERAAGVDAICRPEALQETEQLRESRTVQCHRSVSCDRWPRTSDLRACVNPAARIASGTGCASIASSSLRVS